LFFPLATQAVQVDCFFSTGGRSFAFLACGGDIPHMLIVVVFSRLRGLAAIVLFVFLAIATKVDCSFVYCI